MTIPTLPDEWRSFLGFTGYDHICEMDRNEKYCHLSANYDRLVGRPRAELIGMSPFVEGLIHPDDIAMVRERLRPLFEHDESVCLEYRYRSAKGEWAWAESTGQAFLNSAGEWRCIFISRDTTERKTMEASLAASEADYRALIEHAVDAVLLGDTGGNIIRANQRAFELTGYPVQELLGRNISCLFSKEELAQVPLRYDLLDSGVDLRSERMLTRRDGSLVPIEMNTRKLPDGRYQAFIRDITERREAHAALRESEDRFRGLYENTTDSIFWIAVQEDGAFRYEGANPAHRILTGLGGEQLVGRSPRECFDPDQAARVIENYRRCLTEGHPITYEELSGPGADARELETLLVPIRNSEGRIYRLVGTSRDVTEANATQEAMRRAQKLESLGVLAGGIAHDFNNLLTAILGNLNLAQRKCPPESGARPYLDAVEKTVFKASDLTRQMLAYSGRGQFVVRSHDLNDLVREMANLLEVSISKRISLSLQLSPEPVVIESDGAQVQQVILNLVTNAADAIGDNNGEIVICTRMRQLADPLNEATFTSKNVRPGRYVALQVKDTGCGIHPEMMDRIFDPFFTTKSAGRGLGLSAMLGILRGHEAGYWIRSEQGAGTSFEVLFPASDSSLDTVEKGRVGRLQDIHGTVLLVDDEPEILEALLDALETLGLRVLTARDGLEAIEVFRQNASRIDLVLMDLSMPRMDGREAIQELRKLRPELRVILSSGFPAQSAQELLADGTVGFLQKPYRLEDLQAAISSRLAT